MRRAILSTTLALIILAFAGLWTVHESVERSYLKTVSVEIFDRNGNILLIRPNAKGYLSQESADVAPKLKELLLKKEDRLFQYHIGINPISILKAALAKIGFGNRDGSSTITQQLAKLILSTETDRTFANKLKEAVAAVSMELFDSKKQILSRYVNSAYFGNQVQGVETASRAYFNKSSASLSAEEIMQLLVTLNNPSFNNPLFGGNGASALALAGQLRIPVAPDSIVGTEVVRKNLQAFMENNRAFELEEWLNELPNKNIPAKRIELSIDSALNEKIRESIQSLMPSLYKRNAHNAAVVVLNAHTGEVLSLIGSPDPDGKYFGQQINMLTKKRQIASTVKPLLYVRAFESGLRPYTLVDDKAYIYTTAEGRTIQPKNYDGKYRGKISAEYALANSINVPAIKVLEFLGQDNFMQFLDSLGYGSPEKVKEHQLGAALGTIDMTLVELTHYYSIFPNEGILPPLRLFSDDAINSEFYPETSKRVMDPPYTELITRILGNRYLGIDQFGYQSSLSLPIDSYALKTGTSDDFRDTWVIGYTPDFIVGAWVGNADNTPTQNLSGQSGAGDIWSRTMQIVMNSEYNLHNEFSYDNIEEVQIENLESYGLPGDDVLKARNLLLDSEGAR